MFHGFSVGVNIEDEDEKSLSENVDPIMQQSKFGEFDCAFL